MYGLFFTFVLGMCVCVL